MFSSPAWAADVFVPLLAGHFAQEQTPVAAHSPSPSVGCIEGCSSPSCTSQRDQALELGPFLRPP